MNLIELHIIQSFPVTCLNRDDLGSPKSAIFGGVPRARVSSQCWKRAIRFEAHQMLPSAFSGVRTKLLPAAITEAARKVNDSRSEKLSDEAIEKIVKQLIEIKVGKDAKLFGGTKKNGDLETLFYTSPNAVNALAEYIVNGCLGDAKFKMTLKDVEKILTENIEDGADISLFGRMVASDPDVTVEGAAMFSHALSTHSVRNDLDFFSAVDDAKKGEDDAGAGHIGTIEFNSACYYRYIGVNVDLLKQSKLFDQKELKNVLSTFIRACVTANPVARRNSMFGYTLPACVLGLRRQGQPLSLANAFENPVKSKRDQGVADASVAAMNAEWEALKQTFGVTASKEVLVKRDGASLDQLVESMLADIA